MCSQFQKDLKEAKEAERIVYNALFSLCPDSIIEDVSNRSEYYKKGDLKITLPTGEQRFVEVKDDKTIWKTKNLLCEEENYFKNIEDFVDGNMKSDYDIYAVVSKKENKIYFMDFSIIKKNYKTGEFKAIEHPLQTSYCYLCNMGNVKKWGALLYTANY